MERWWQVAIVSVAGLAAVSLINFYLAIRPARIIIPVAPADYGLSVEEVGLTAEDRVRLAGWYIPAEDESLDRPAVILLHGYPAEKADMLSIAWRLRPHAATFLLDSRYFGESGGWSTTLGVKEPGDVRLAVAWLKERGHERVGVFGFSFGGAMALMAAAEEPDIERVGAYAAYADLRQLGYETFWILPGVNYLLVEAMNLWSGVFFGELVSSVSPRRAAERLDKPVWLTHSRQDEQISFRHAERLEAALGGNDQAEFYWLDGMRHGQLPEDFYERLVEFFSSGSESLL